LSGTIRGSSSVFATGKGGLLLVDTVVVEHPTTLDFFFAFKGEMGASGFDKSANFGLGSFAYLSASS